MTSIEIRAPQSLRVQRIDTDCMEPTLMRGAYVLVKPCTEFGCGGPYLIDVDGCMVPYIVTRSGREVVWLRYTTPRYRKGAPHVRGRVRRMCRRSGGG